MKSGIILSVDVEPDLHYEDSKTYESVDRGLLELERMAEKGGIKPVLFVTADCVKHNPALFRRLMKKGWEVSLHGFSHRRFDDMSLQEKEEEIVKSLRYWKKYLKSRPLGFRAPQHSIDDETLDLLVKHGFVYDSSYTPLNFLQLLFFPKKPLLWLKHFFSPRESYKIRLKLEERPPSALLLPFVSLVVRVFPPWLLSLYVGLLKRFYTCPHFYAHSWDFISLPKSRTDRMFPHTQFIKKMEFTINRFI